MFSPALEAEVEAALRSTDTLRVAAALTAGTRDENDLTNLVFGDRHPDRGGRPLKRTEPDFGRLSREWLDVRSTLVRPLLWAYIRADAQRIALGEWRWWGNGTRVENEPDVRDRLLEYWRAATPSPPTGDAVWQWAWSAAFISYVLRHAGAGSHFQYSTAHRVYLHRAIRNATTEPGHPIQALPVTAVRPRVGDLVCTWRSGRRVTYAQLAAMAAPPSGHPMHCDIVTEVGPGEIRVVGGNKAPAPGVACGTGHDGCTVNSGRHALTGGVLAPLTGTRSGWIAVVRIGP
ncbi:MAG TPA: DUF2272 domain-containing protein [Micromonosporaceae bacterium]|nr:DUF2272 domain-containing protein [Micromonosporaceae bacterium]